jgi:hypothetical protein
LGGTSLVTLGISQNWDYVTNVLPSHALSELGSDAQLSLSVVLHALGASDRLAVIGGEVCYVFAALMGIAVAGSLSRRFDDGAFVVVVPGAMAVIGGVFMHVTQVSAAIPLALLLLSYTSPKRSLQMPAVILVLLSVPWWSLATPMALGTVTGCLLAAVVVACLVSQLSQNSLLAFALGASVFIGGTQIAHWYSLSNESFVPPEPLRISIDSRYAEASWAWENARYFSTGSLPAWLLRLPTWGGLLLLAGLSCAKAASPEVRKAQAVAA